MRFQTIIGFVGLLCLTFVACNREVSLTYTADFATHDVGRATYLTQALERVMVRKLSSFGINHPRVTAIYDGKHGATVTFIVPSTKEVREAIAKMMKEELTFDVRVEKKEETDTKDITGNNWASPTLTGSSLVWVQAIGDKTTGNISLELQFNDRGKEILKGIFEENQGKSLGIFVRDLLVSKLLIQGSLSQNSIRISGVPSEQIAKVFSDDVNVGLYTVFSLKN